MKEIAKIKKKYRSEKWLTKKYYLGHAEYFLYFVRKFEKNVLIADISTKSKFLLTPSLKKIEKDW